MLQRNTPETMMHAKLDALIARAKQFPPPVVAVAHPCDAASLDGALQAAAAGLITPILVGPALRIQSLGRDLRAVRIVDTPHSHASAARAVELVRAGEAQALMKGSLHTDELMAEVIAKDTGLRTARRVSHVFVLDVPAYDKLLLVTDAAVNIFPTLDEKADIIANAIELAAAIGIETPKIAILSAVETVTAKIPSTIEAAALCKMADRGQITGALLDGPLAFDNAINLAAAATKHIVSPVAGKADILMVPDLEAGNMLVKTLTFLSGADGGGIVLGARVPVILTSRADTIAARLASAAVCVLLANARAAGKLLAD